MPLYILNRNYTHRSTSGVVSFVKGEASWVPPYMETEILAIGGECLEGDSPDLLPEDQKPVVPLTGDDRRDQLFTAFQMIYTRNDSKDFTGAGVPTVKAVEKIVEFDVDRNEVVALWGEFKVELVEANEG